ncbi:MAG: proteasome assembly chaperone family protein [Halococcoides sp.]
MDEFEVDATAEVELSDPVLVEGLPGVGHVGKLAAEQLIEELESTCVRKIVSTHFPPQVTIEDGTADLAHVALTGVPVEEGRDLLVLTGDHQAQDAEGHYGLAEAILDVAESFGVEEVFALGGVPIGELIEEYDVVGAVADDQLREPLESVGVEFREDEPAGGIVGISGLLLGIGDRRGFSAACLMGETSGYLVDPKAARAVLETLEAHLGIELAYESLAERADEMEDVVRRIQEMEQGTPTPADEDLRYIG